MSGGDLVTEYYLVCLMDLLGQVDRLAKWERLAPDGDPNDKLVEAVAETVGRVTDFREMFIDHFKAQSKPPSAALRSKLSKAEFEQVKRMREATIRTQQFSDTFVFYCPLRNKYGDVTGEAVDWMLGAAAIGLLAGLAAGTPPRGAIVIRAGTEIEAGNFYGPALAAVHRIESRIAQYPRVVVSPEVMDFAERKTGFSDDPDLEAKLQRLKAKGQDYVCTDSDGATIVDYMGADFFALVGHHKKIRTLAARAYQYANLSANRYLAEGEPVLAQRYQRLIAYMTPRLGRWGIKP